MAYSDLWSQIKYLAPYSYILDTNIVEYDIEKANINVLRYNNAIDDETYRRLYNMPKLDREVTVGRMIRRNKDLSIILKNGIQDARHKLFSTLQLNSESILAIDNDAVFIIFNGPSSFSDIQINELVKFRVKGHFRSFYYLNKKQFFYTYDPITNREGLNIKGVGDYGIEKGQGFIRLLCDIFYSNLSGGVRRAYDVSTAIYNDYIAKKYPMEYYRRLDSNAKFDIYNISNYCIFQADVLEDNALGVINPAYNQNMLRTLISYYTDAIYRQM